MSVDMTIDFGPATQLLTKQQKNGPWDDYEMYKLSLEIERAKLVHEFDEMICLNMLPHIKPMEHQLLAAKKVLYEMSGRAILADEVGLGKTIEAGIILKEYVLRGLAKKVLILVPATLVLQWVRELNEKFDLNAFAQKKVHSWQYNIVVASIDTAKRPPHRDILLATDYDLVLVDEAHKLKNRKTTSYQFIHQLRKKYCLLLTATPLQNNMKELYNLITLLKPGQLGDAQQFTSQFVADERTAKNEEQLQQTLSSVMIRNRRATSDVRFTKRQVTNVALTLSEQEKNLYEAICTFVKSQHDEQSHKKTNALALLTLQREVCSSRDAVFVTLVNLFKKTDEQSPVRPKIWQLVEHIRAIGANTKAEKALEIVRTVNEKCIIFTEYRATQQYLLNYCKQHGISAIAYSGGMNRGKKDWMMDLFRGHAQVLIATEAGGEGINLQFCHHLINFDLPWNPMKLEQRIGRIHRLGQQHDVTIYNLYTTDTIEEHVISLLHQKIALFESVIGDLDPIISGAAASAKQFERQLAQKILERAGAGR